MVDRMGAPGCITSRGAGWPTPIWMKRKERAAPVRRAKKPGAPATPGEEAQPPAKERKGK